MTRRRPTQEQAIAVTGLGLVLPMGSGLAAADAVFRAETAVGYLDGSVGLEGATGAPASVFSPPAGTEWEDRAAQMAVAAADQAWHQARLAQAGFPPDRVAVILGLSKGGVFAMSRWAGAPVGAADMIAADPAAAARLVAGRYGLTGPVLTPVTACASGGHALAWAGRLLRRGTVDAALVGAAEASLHPIVLGCYRRMGVLAPAEGDPASSVRPFSATRRGFAIGEGAGVLVLESGASAARRGIRPLAIVRGWAAGAYAAGLTRVDGSGAALGRLIRTALGRAAVPAAAIDYVHAHGTATPANDAAEARAIRLGLGPAAEVASVSSTKGSHGHLLGAAAAAEVVLTVLAIRRNCVPPTANLTDPDPAVRLDCTPLRPKRRAIGGALKLSAGFGGQAVAIVLSAPDGRDR